MDPAGNKPIYRVVAPKWAQLAAGNELAVEDEGDLDAVGAAEICCYCDLASICISRETWCAEYLLSLAEVDFYGYSVPRDGVQFLEAMWKKYGNFIMYFKLGIFVRGATLTLLCCVLAQMRNTNLKDVTETKILEWKSVQKELLLGVTAEAADDVLTKVVHEVIAEIVENASNLQEILAVNDVTALGMIPKQDSHSERGSGCSPQDRDCDLGRCETADFYEFLLALMGVHYSFIVASANTVIIEKECMNVDWDH
uniref:Uncharacterized protein n=1 Tax=Fagus sylvatica TaxID=28930 RepID=A0A2N9F1P3_FAGSY